MPKTISEQKEELRKNIEGLYGETNVWDTKELTEVFNVESFLAPFCLVTRKKDRKRGMVMFNDRPRLYFDFKPI